MTKAKFAVGSNMPGYMPDSEAAHGTWGYCHDLLVWELSHSLDLADDPEVQDDVVSLQETLKRAKALKRGDEFGETVANRHYWLSRA